MVLFLTCTSVAMENLYSQGLPKRVLTFIKNTTFDRKVMVYHTKLLCLVVQMLLMMLCKHGGICQFFVMDTCCKRGGALGGPNCDSFFVHVLIILSF